jgi:hypothetical protein
VIILCGTGLEWMNTHPSADVETRLLSIYSRAIVPGYSAFKAQYNDGSDDVAIFSYVLADGVREDVPGALKSRFKDLTIEEIETGDSHELLFVSLHRNTAPAAAMPFYIYENWFIWNPTNGIMSALVKGRGSRKIPADSLRRDREWLGRSHKEYTAMMK